MTLMTKKFSSKNITFFSSKYVFEDFVFEQKLNKIMRNQEKYSCLAFLEKICIYFSMKFFDFRKKSKTKSLKKYFDDKN